MRSMFETDRVPARWLADLKTMDGIIVPTRFNVETFTTSGIAPEKLYVVPSPIDTDRFVPVERKHHDEIHFVSMFDWSSRKGWEILLTAWFRAFSGRDPVKLTIKTMTITLPTANPHRDVEQLLSRLGKRREDCAPVEILNARWTEDQLVAFYQDADVFVLPTRGEGWGRPIVEAMACGLPVIATNWSAPTEYLTESNSLPLKIKGLIKIPDDVDYEMFKGGYWADPDVDHLIFLLRYVLSNFDTVRGLGSAARQTAERYHPKNVVRQLMDVLNQFGVGSN